MPAPPKPERRAPKPKKPIKRSWIKRTAAALRRQAVEMVAKNPIARTKRPNRIRKTSTGKEKHAADLAWSKAVRAKGPCIARGMRLFSDTQFILGECHGRVVTIEHQRCDELTAAHIIRRGYMATRHDLDNGVPLCFSAHSFFTRHPDQWTDFISDYLGAEKYEALRKKALAGPHHENTGGSNG